MSKDHTLLRVLEANSRASLACGVGHLKKNRTRSWPVTQRAHLAQSQIAVKKKKTENQKLKTKSKPSETQTRGKLRAADEFPVLININWRWPFLNLLFRHSAYT